MGKIISFFFWFKHGFPWSKEEKKHNFTFTFSDIVSIHPVHKNDMAMEKNRFDFILLI